MSQTINIAVAAKKATTDFREVVSHNSTYDLTFTFDDEWAEFPQRVVVFLWEGGGCERLMRGETCEMPAIKSDGEELHIGVYAVRGESLIASTFVRLNLEQGAQAIPWQNTPEENTFHQDVIAYLNGKDWSVFDDKMEEGTYTALTVNKKGVVTAGKTSFEVGADGQTSPSETLVENGLFFKKDGATYAVHQKEGEGTQELPITGARVKNALVVGAKSYNGSAQVSVTKADLGLTNTPDFHPYPVGAIYLSVADTSPASLFGGTWERLSDGRVLVAANDSYPAGSTGGSAAHAHTGFAKIITNGDRVNWRSVDTALWPINISMETGVGTQSTQGWYMDKGTELSIDNSSSIPPYLAVYMWKRVA